MRTRSASASSLEKVPSCSSCSTLSTCFRCCVEARYRRPIALLAAFRKEALKETHSFPFLPSYKKQEKLILKKSGMAEECVRRALMLQGVTCGERVPADVLEVEEKHVKWPSLFDGFVEQMRTKQPEQQGVPCGEVCAVPPAAQPACTCPGGLCPSVNSSLSRTRRSGELLLYTRRSSRSSRRTFLANSMC